MCACKSSMLLVCVLLFYLVCSWDCVHSVDIECMPLRSCPTIMKLVQITKRSPEAMEFFRHSHCGFDEKNQPKVWCSKLDFCVTPQNRNGTCTPLKKCEPFLQLTTTLDTTDPEVINFLNKFRCNEILEEEHVCCQDVDLQSANSEDITSFRSTRAQFDYYQEPATYDSSSFDDYQDYNWPNEDEPFKHSHHHGYYDTLDPYHKTIDSPGPEYKHPHPTWHNQRYPHGSSFADYGQVNNRWNIYQNMPEETYYGNSPRTTSKSPDDFSGFGSWNNREEDHGVSNNNNKRGTHREENHVNQVTASDEDRNYFEYTTPKRTQTTYHVGNYDPTSERTIYKQTTSKGRSRETIYSINNYDNNGERNGTAHKQNPTNTRGILHKQASNNNNNKPNTSHVDRGISSEEDRGYSEHTTMKIKQISHKQTTPRDRSRDRTDPDNYDRNNKKTTHEQTTSKPLTTRKPKSTNTTPSRKKWTTNEQTTPSTRRTTSSYRRPTTKGIYSNEDESDIIFFVDSFEDFTKGKWSTTEQSTKSSSRKRTNQDKNKKFCQTPDKKTGICMRSSNCQRYITLQNTLDKSKKATRDYLNKFRCNSEEICCEEDEKNVIDNSLFNAERSNENVPEPISKICGRQTASNDRIVGGTLANLGEFPWMALLQYPSNRGIQTGCGGTLINSRYVVTAAHCVDERFLSTIQLRQVRQVVLGEYDTRNKTDCIYMPLGQDCADPPKIYRVESIIAHNLYSFSTTRHDIALVRLEQEVTFSDYIKPICLPTKTSTLRGNETFIMAGWGKTETEELSPILRKAKISIVNKENCNRNNSPLIEGQICVGRGNGTDSCKGDSGGPLMLEVNFNFEFVTHLVGVISYGFGKICGTGPSVNTYVPYYVDWINDNVKQ